MASATTSLTTATATDCRLTWCCILMMGAMHLSNVNSEAVKLKRAQDTCLK